MNFGKARAISVIIVIINHSLAIAQYQAFWTLDNLTAAPSGAVEASPGNASLKDDHVYRAGVYPAPIGVVATSEPSSQVENALTSSDPALVLHFSLGTQEATSASYRLILKSGPTILGGGSAFTTSFHRLTVSLNGTEISRTKEFEEEAQFFFTLPETAIQVGENVLRIERTGGSDDSQLLLRAIELQQDPVGGQDQDGDGLPARYERDFLTSDQIGSDAALDPDGDGLSNLQEFQAGTRPDLDDTDRDGLVDGAETASSPLLADTDGDGLTDHREVEAGTVANRADSDGDGASDSWELVVGTDPRSASSTPPAIPLWGLNFRSIQDPSQGQWPADTVVGIIPQARWNHTFPLLEVDSRSDLNMLGTPAVFIDKAQVAGPSAGQVVDAAGMVSPLNFSIRQDGVRSRSSFGQTTLTNQLLNGTVEFASDASARLEFTGVPAGTYRVYAYVAPLFPEPNADFPIVQVGVDGLASQQQEVAAFPISANRGWVVAQEASSGKSERYGNVVEFSNVVPDASGNLRLTFQVPELTFAGNANPRRLGEAGLAAVQLVSQTSDADLDLLPDYWELRYATGVMTPSSGDDADGDGLTNAQEFAEGTDPQQADTDGDGLTDGEEVSQNLNPLSQDSDGDRLTDREERNAVIPSAANNADTDGDGTPDLDEQRGGELTFQTGTGPHPHAEPDTPELVSATEFVWEIKNLQILWNHNQSLFSRSGLNERILYLSIIRNANATSGFPFFFRLTNEDYGVAYRFNSSSGNGFGSINWEVPSGPSAEMLQQGLGFAGSGSHDLSDPFTMSFRAQRATTSSVTWDATFTLTNERTGAVLANRQGTVVPSPAVLATNPGPDYSAEVILGESVTAVRTTVDLQGVAGVPKFADVDNDGMDDAWESQFAVTDPEGDPDQDRLTNLLEFRLGSNPNARDSDGDGVGDRAELFGLTSLADSQSIPFGLNLPLDGDFNQNQMRDSWERQFPTGLLAGGDPDGDAVSNLDESIAGTNPFLAASRPFARAMPAPDGGELVQFPRLAGKQVTILESPDLIQPFRQIVSTPTVRGNLAEISLGDQPTGRFLRLAVSDLDSDSDGVTDWEEEILGSNAVQGGSVQSGLFIDTNNDEVPDTFRAGDYLALAEAIGASGGNGAGQVSPKEAARLLNQATFGPILKEIHQVRALGVPGWINSQQQLRPTLHTPYLRNALAQAQGTDPVAGQRVNVREVGTEGRTRLLDGTAVMVPFARAAVLGEDQLRQRVAFALSQMLVVSRRDPMLSDRPLGLANYYDILVRHAFGNYFDILKEVTAHPVMGVYLSHLGNEKARPAQNIFPDENYAREVMQLFTIGLWELNQDGTRKVDGNGNFIPTYDTEDIEELARVMTGYWFGDAPAGGGSRRQEAYAVPMQMLAERHDFEEKSLLGGDLVIPERTPSVDNAQRDVEDALRHLFEHENTAPFVSQALIRFLVTDNPTPAYVGRVAAVFADNGSGVRGDLGAVVRAILLDEEARSPREALVSDSFGRLRDPLVRYMHLARLIGMTEESDFAWWDNGEFESEAGQAPLASPSVFNFYQPDYSPPGVLQERGLNGASFQVLDNFTAVALPNRFWFTFLEGFRSPSASPGSLPSEFRPDYGHLLPYAETSYGPLLDYLNLTVCAGRMTAATRSRIWQDLDGVYYDRPRNIHQRISLALYAAFISPESAVQR